MTANRYRVDDEKRICVEMKLKSASQLFDARDPAPFRERDLDGNAVDYILTAANEFPARTPMKLVIYISEQASVFSSELVRDAIWSYFSYEQESSTKKLNYTLRKGRTALLVGLFFLFTCISISKLIESNYGTSLITSVLAEGLIIMGWVAMWKPIDMFLYSWWPLAESRKIYKKLSSVPIEVVKA